MKNIIAIIASLSILSASHLMADGVAALVMGKVQLKNDAGSWVPVKVNSTIKSADLIRIPEGGRITLKLANGSMISLTTAREVRLSDLESQQSANSQKSVSQLLREKGQKLTDKNRQGNVTAVAGVRGADVDSQNPNKADPDQMTWKE